MKLIPNWKRAWRFLSMQAMAADGLFNMAYVALPSFRAALTEKQFAYLNGGFLVTAMCLRLVQQWVAVTPEEKEALIQHAENQPERIEDQIDKDPL